MHLACGDSVVAEGRAVVLGKGLAVLGVFAGAPPAPPGLCNLPVPAGEASFHLVTGP